MPFLNNKYKATDPGKFNSVQDRQSFLEEFNKSYDEWQEQRNAANQAEEKRRPILDRIEDATSKSRLRKREREAARSKAYYTLLNSLKTRDDFDELSAMGQRKAANGLFDRTNMTGKSAEEQGVVKETRDDAFHQNIYDYMTPEQKSMYYAFLGLGDQQSAKRYLASIEEGLQKQAAEKLTETIQPGNIENVQDFADVTRLGVRSGIGRFETGVQQLVNPNAVSKNYTEMAFEEARKDMSGATGVVADLANTVGFMLLPAGGSMVLGLAGGAGLAGSAGVKALSASLFGAASGGSTYNDMLKENPGANRFDAKVYSVINGALEGSLQYALGGIGKLGVGGLSKVTGKTISGAVAKKLSNVAKASANTPAVKGLIKALVGGGKWAAGTSDEALEEWLQAVLDPVMRNYVLGENNEVKLFGEDQLYAAFLGALGATVMNAPNNVGSFANAEQILNETVAKQEAKAAVRANKGQPANAGTPDVPEITTEQIKAHFDDPTVGKLVDTINRLEALRATDKKKYHHNRLNGAPSIESNLARAQAALAQRIQALEQEQSPEQAAPADIPEMPKAPVENEEAIETLMRELGNVQDTDEAQPSGEQQLGEQARERALQLQEELGLTEEAPVEDEALPAEDEALPVEDEELPDEELPDEELPAGEEEEYEGYTLEETVDRFRADIAEAKRNRKVMRGEGYDYNQYIKMLEINFRHDAAELGMSKAEIEAIINSEGSTTRTVNRKEKVAPNPTETASEAVTDEDIDEAINPAEDQDELRGIVDAVQDEELTSDEAIDEIDGLLNQWDAEREATGEAVGVATEPEVTVTEGRIEVRFPKWPGRKTTDELRKAGFKWDKEAGIWFGGENNTNRALVERLTGVKLTEDEFVPQTKRIPKEELDNGEPTGNEVPNSLTRGKNDWGNGETNRGIQSEEGRRSLDYEQRLRDFADSQEYSNARTEIIKGLYRDYPDIGIKRKYNKYFKDYLYYVPVSLTHLFGVDQEHSLKEWGDYEQAFKHPCWGLVLKAQEQWKTEVADIPLLKQPNLVLYAHEQLTNGQLVEGSYYQPSEKTLYINMSIVEGENLSIGHIIKHEFCHYRLLEQSGFRENVIESLRKEGLNDVLRREIVVNYFAPAWDYYYGEDLSDPTVYQDYEDEFICELYSHEADITDALLNSEIFDGNANIANSVVEKWQQAVTRASIKYDASREGGVYRQKQAWEDELQSRLDVESTSDNRSAPSLIKATSATKEPTATSSTFTENAKGNIPAENVIPELREVFDSMPESVRNYVVKHQTDINAEAWKNVVKKGGVDTVAGTLLKASRWNPLQLEMAVEIGKCFAVNGEHDRAAEITTKIIGQQREFGRAIKYLETLQQYMPHAVAAIGHSIANELDVKLTEAEEKDLALCDEILEDGFITNSVIEAASPEFRDWLEKAQYYVDVGTIDATTAAYGAASRIVGAHEKSTFRDKFRALQRISLLSNVKTHGRNILGNAAEVAGSVMSRPVGMLADRALSKVTGERTYGSGGGRAFIQSIAPGVEQAIMDHKLELSTVGNKFDESSKRNGVKNLAQQKAFNEKTDSTIRNTVSKTLNSIDELIGLGLSIGDAPFLLGHYNDALAQLMSNNPDLTEPTAEMIDTAWDVAYRRTFRDDNAVTKALSSIRNSLPGIGETIAPYVQTPVNVVLTAIEYSPIGFIEAVSKIAFGENSLTSLKSRGEGTMKVQRQIADLFGRGAIGTAFMVLGAFMKAAGKISDDDDDIESQKEKNWNTATGRRGSSIKFGDKYVDPSSMQSLSTPLMAGAAAYDSENGTDWGGILGAAVKASMKMGNTMLEMPVLQGVADLFSGNYDDGEIIAGLLGLAGNAATQVVPFGSAMRQAAKTADPYARVQSEINEGPFKRIVKNTANNLKAMVPGVRETLPERYDVLGNPIKNDASRNLAERAYNSFINPFNTSRENKNDVTDEIDRLYAALQDTDVLPTAAGNSISYNGEKYEFTSAEKQEYQRIEGESNSEILSSLVNSEAYDGLTDEEKAKILESVYKYSGEQAKRAYFDKKGIEYKTDETWMDKIDALVEGGMDIGSAIVYRYEINQIDGADDQAYYIMDLPISADQKKALDTQFVDKFGFRPIKDDRDYTSKDALVLSMTSDKGRDKYNRIFSGQWTGSSGNTYPALTGEQFGDFYDAFYFKESPKAAESTESIKQMLMQKYGMDEDSAYIMAYDFRKIFASTKL